MPEESPQPTPRPGRDIMHFLVSGKDATNFSYLQIATREDNNRYDTKISGSLNGDTVDLQMRTEEMPAFSGYHLAMQGKIGNHHVVEHYNSLATPDFIKRLNS
jgi:hypothetical protein